MPRRSLPTTPSQLISRFAAGLARGLKDLAGLFYPELCASCDEVLVEGEDTFCLYCRMELPWTFYHLRMEHALARRFRGRVELERAMAWLHFVKQGSVQRILHAIKYRDRPDLAVALGRLYGRELAAAGLSACWDAIVPVPMHRSKERKRGYNVAERIAAGLSLGLSSVPSSVPSSGVVPGLEQGQLPGGSQRPPAYPNGKFPPTGSEGSSRVPLLDVLTRTAAGSSQTDKDRFARWENVRELYALRGGPGSGALTGARLLLVDDVVTTGATLEVCASRLLEGGAASVSVCCLACAPDG